MLSTRLGCVNADLQANGYGPNRVLLPWELHRPGSAMAESRGRSCLGTGLGMALADCASCSIEMAGTVVTSGSVGFTGKLLGPCAADENTAARSHAAAARPLQEPNEKWKNFPS